MKGPVAVRCTRVEPEVVLLMRKSAQHGSLVAACLVAVDLVELIDFRCRGHPVNDCIWHIASAG